MSTVAERVELAGWDRNAYMLEYFNTSIGYAINHYGNNRSVIHDHDVLENIAMDALLDVLDQFPDWCLRERLAPTPKLFRAVLFQHVDWMALNEIKRIKKRRLLSMDESFGEDGNVAHPLLVAHDLQRYQQVSLLQHTLADRVAVLPLKWKLVIALRFAEEMSLEEIAVVTGITVRQLGEILTRATRTLLEHAYHEVQTNTPAPAPVVLAAPWEVPFTVHRWVWLHTLYIDVHSYLGSVQRGYGTDVTYMVDMLNRAHGAGPNHGHKGKPERRKCGSRRAYQDHVAAGEPIDDACAAARDRHLAWKAEHTANARRDSTA